MPNETPKPIVFLQGERLYLRPLELADTEICQRWINDPETRLSLAGFMPYNEGAEREFIEKKANTNTSVTFAIVLNESDRPIGACGLMSIRWKDRAAEFGIMIGETDLRGQGYGTEATKLILKYAFEELNLNRVQLCVFDFNQPGMRSYEKAGFTREGVQREHSFKAGRYVDHLVYGILAREYFEQHD